MPDVDAEILKLLRDGSKHYSELKQIIVEETEICSNQTLSNHLKRLREDNIISKKILPNRRTIYEIIPEYVRKLTRIEDLSKLKFLMENIPDRIIDDNLGMEEIKVEKRTGILKEWVRSVSYFKNRPNLRFALYFDKELIEKLKYFLKIEDVAKEFRDKINSYFREIEKTIPPTINIKLFEESKNFSDWDNSLANCEKIANKHNFQFLMYTWYDGKKYSESILSALKTLNNLKKGHENYVLFLNEISKKCYYSRLAYWTEAELFEVFFSEILDRLPLESIGFTCFIGFLFGWIGQAYKVLTLDAALTSETILKKHNDIPTIKELGVTKKEKIPYNLIDRDSFLKMKYNFLSDEVKYTLLKKGFNLAKEWLQPNIIEKELYHPLFQIKAFRENPERTLDKIEQNIEFYEEEMKLKTIEELDIEMSQYNIIFNFQYKWNNKIIDLNDNPMVEEFKSFLNNSIKRKWLQSCLDNGIPIWATIPFKELGFDFASIL